MNGETVTLPGPAVRETTLANGVRVLTERIPAVRSASVGVWVRHGSAHETPGRMGVSHLLEHMVFKGTERRSAREIALALESLGGALDAYTTREHTAFQARVLDEHLPEALDVLADLTLRPRLREADLDLEREVVLEEIATVEDTPDDLVFDLHGELLWDGHPYGHPILGTRETVASLTAAELRRVHRAHYRGRNLVVAAAGHVDHDDVVTRVRDLFGGVDEGEPPPPVPGPGDRPGGDERVTREGSQTHLVVGSRSVAHHDPRRYALVLLSSAFGGGMSSRLFQKVREEMALAYAVFSFHSFYVRSGILGVYVGTRPEWEERALEAVLGEFGRLAREGLPPAELEQTRQQVKGQITLSLESTGARLARLAGSALYEEEYLDPDELLRRIDAVDRETVAEVARTFLDPGRQLALRLGPDRSSA